MFLRCDGRIIGELIEIERGGEKIAVLETKCRSQQCGAREFSVVLHRFNTATWELIETIRVSDPAKTLQKEKTSANRI